MAEFGDIFGKTPVLHPAGRERILMLMATDKELGPHLKSLIEPAIIGVGPVEAAAGTAAALGYLLARDEMPTRIVSLGSAGSRTLEQGAVYQVASVSYRDIDASALGFEKGRTPFSDHPHDIALETPFGETPKARLSTGGKVISGADYDPIDADMVDMESFAVVRAAARFKVPVVGLRGISDGAEELRHYNDWASTLEALDAHLASALSLYLARLAESD